jgi:hypothetical protein
MLSGDRWWMLAGFGPYLAVALYDGWLHEKARRVPFAEQCFHAAIAVSLCVLWWALHAERPQAAIAALAAFAVAASVDEFRFHGALSRHERRLHFLGYACFAGFAVVVYRLGGFG